MAMSIPREERDAGNIRKVEEVGLLNGGAIIHSSLQRIRLRHLVKLREREKKGAKVLFRVVSYVRRKKSPEFPYLVSSSGGAKFGKVLHSASCT